MSHETEALLSGKGDSSTSDVSKSEEKISKTDAAIQFAKLAVPFSLTRFIGTASQFAGAWMLSKKGHNYLAASGLITALDGAVHTTSAASLYATGILEGEAIAAGKKGEIGELLNASYRYAVLLGIANAAIFYFADPILRNFGQNPTVTKIVGEYYKAYVSTAGPISALVSVSGQQTAYAIGKAEVSVGINVIRRGIYLGLAYWLINGGLGIEGEGAAGLAYANSISTALDALAFAIYYKTNKELSEYGFFEKTFSESSVHFKRMVKRSVLIGVQTFNEFLFSFVNTMFIGSIGVVPLAASEIATQYNSLVKIPVLSAAQSAGIEVSKLAKNSLVDAGVMSSVSLVLSMFIPLVVLPIFMFTARAMAEPFVDDSSSDADEIYELAQMMLLMSAINQLPNTIRSVCGGILRGYDSYYVSAIVNSVSLSLIGLPASYCLTFLSNLSSIGPYVSGTIAYSTAATGMYSFWKRNDKKQALSALEYEAIHASEDLETSMGSRGDLAVSTDIDADNMSSGALGSEENDSDDSSLEFSS